MIARLGQLVTLGGWTLALLIGLRLAFGLYRFARLSRAAKWNYPFALWARFRWRWLTRNLNLAYLDQHRRASRRPSVPFGTSVKVKTPSSGSVAKLRFPRAKFRADEFGIIARVRTVPGVGRAEFDKNSPYIADAWRCVRVQVTQPKPGRVVVRGLRQDPLTQPFNTSAGPANKWSDAPGNPVTRLYIGRDEWAADRSVLIPRLSGITVGGLTGYGKTSLINSWLMQLAPSADAQFVIIDGKGAADYSAWDHRAWLHTGDDLEEAATALEDAHALMRRRFANRSSGPLVVVVVDECHTFLDLDAVKGDRTYEQYVRTCRAMLGQLVRKGRAARFLSILATQKQTADAIPTAIRDNCGLGLSFAVRTREAAVASLGESIRDYPSQCPTGLQDPVYVAVATVSLRTGLDPYVRVRVPEVTAQAASERAEATVQHRRDLAKVVQLVKDPRHILPAAR